MKEFKVGDKVYCPAKGTKIFTLLKSDNEYLPLGIYEGNLVLKLLTSDGCELYEKHSIIHHATHENQELPEKLYGVEFEKPPAPPTSKEIIQAMLARGEEITELPK